MSDHAPPSEEAGMPTDLLARALREAGATFAVEGDLQAALDALSAGRTVDRATVEEMGTALHERVQAVGRGLTMLRTVTQRVQHLARVVELTELGWPATREHLREVLDRDPAAGRAEWLDFALTAASRMQTNALLRLVDEVPLTGSVVLQDRIAALRAALSVTGAPEDVGHQMSLAIARSVFAPAVAGLTVDGTTVPDPAVRSDLRALWARLALRAGMHSEAELALSGAPDDVDDDRTEAQRLALRAQAAAARGDDAGADGLCAAARRLDATQPDVAQTSILLRRRGLTEEPEQTGTRGRRDLDGALGAARAAVVALESLADVDAELGVLLDPAPELWHAVAERAAAEGDTQTCRHGIEQVAADPSRADGTLRASAAEILASIEVEPDAQVEALTQAGDARSGAGQFRLAADCYRRAMRVDGASDRLHALAALSLADIVAVTSQSLPYREVAAELDEAIRLARSVGEHLDLAGSESWCYLVIAVLDKQLARAEDQPKSALMHEALLASARAVAFLPDAASRWAALGDAADELDLEHLAYECFARTGSITGDLAHSGIARTLANMGRFDEVVTVLDGIDDTWEACARGFAYVRSGRPAEAVREFESLAEVDPTWAWAWASHVLALLTLERQDDALAVVRGWLGQLDNQQREMSGLAAQALAAFVAQDVPALLSAGERLRAAEGQDGGDGQNAIARALLLGGRTAEAVDAWTLLLESATNPLAVTDWARLERPLIESMLGTLPDEVARIDEVARRRLAEFEAVDADVDLTRLRQDGAANAELTADLCAALLAVAHGGPVELAAVLDGPGRWDDLAAEVTSLRAYADQLSQQAVLSSLAREAVETAVRGDEDQAAAALRRLLDEAPWTTDDLLREASGEVPPEVLQVLGALADDPAYALAASTVLGWLGTPTDTGAGADTLRVFLPASWFAGLTDPVSQHEIFLVALPTLRVTSPVPIPTVRVVAAPELEPDGYLVLAADDIVLSQGTVPADRRYLPDHALPVGHALEPDDRVPAGWKSVADDPAIALLTLSPTELVATLLGQVVQRRAAGD